MVAALYTVIPNSEYQLGWKERQGMQPRRLRAKAPGRPWFCPGSATYSSVALGKKTPSLLGRPVAEAAGLYISEG